jgi:hypothetical protein
MASAYKTTQCHNPDDHNVNSYCSENLKIYIPQASETNDELLCTLRKLLHYESVKALFHFDVHYIFIMFYVLLAQII